MNAKFWYAALAYIGPTFPLGYLWHLSTFKAQYDALAMYRADLIIPLGLASMIIQGLLFAWLYRKLFSTARDRWMKSAMQFFMIFATLAWSFLVLPAAAKYNMTSVSQFILLETTFTIIQYAVTAPLIALAWRDRS
jgi:hypothetical protein